MLVLDIPRKFDGRTIDIPHYHRTHLSLTALSEVDVCLLEDPELTYPQLLVSTVRFAKWHRLFRLTATLQDRPGLLSSIFAVLRRNGADVLAEESSSVGQAGLHFIEAIFDIGTDLQQDERAAIITRDLQARLIRDVTFDNDSKPRLKVRPVSSARAAARFGATPHLLHDTATARLVYVNEKRQMLRVQLPSVIRRRFGELLSDQDGGSGKAKGFYLRTSDTKDRLIRILVFKASEPVLHVRVEHWDRMGALEALTAALFSGGFDILTSFSALGESHGRAVFEVVIRSVSDPLGIGSSTEELKLRVEQSLASDGNTGLDVDVSYPKDYSNPIARLRLKGERPSDVTVEQPEPAPSAVLDGFLAEVDSSEGSTPASADLPRIGLARSLTRHFPGSARHAARPRVFISCHFADGSVLEAAKRGAQKCGLEAVTGERLEEDDDKRKGLVRLVRSCDAFLGVWSPHGGNTTSGGLAAPSPWLLWELGVAHASDIEWRLVVSRLVESGFWQRIAADKQHYLYREAELETRIGEALESIATRLRTAHR